MKNDDLHMVEIDRMSDYQLKVEVKNIYRMLKLIPTLPSHRINVINSKYFPKCYVSGMTNRQFFYDKVKYLFKRLVKGNSELIERGMEKFVKKFPYKVNKNKFSKHLLNDYSPSEKDRRKSLYYLLVTSENSTWYGEELNREDYENLLLYGYED